MPTVQIAKEPKVIVPSQTIELRKQDGKRIVQMWLADDSFTYENPITHKKFRLSKQALPTIAKTIVGNKYLVPPTLDHPRHQEPNPYDVNVDIERINEAGRPFEAGTFFDIHPQQRYGNDGYDAFAEMDSELGIRLFDAGLLPRYNSTSILKLNNDEPEDDVKTARINNICAVKYPNFGIRASLQGMCVGDRDDCKNELINNSAQDWANMNMTTMEMSGTNASDGYQVTLESCPTMEALKQLPEDSKFMIENTIFKGAEVTHSSNINMSAQPNLGTTDATVTYDFPNSKRQIRLDGKGKIISDTHPSDKLPEGFKGMANPPATETRGDVVKIETEKPKGDGNGNGDNNNGGGEQQKNADGSLQVGSKEKEQEKKEETITKKEQSEVEKPEKDNPDNGGDQEREKKDANNVQTDRVTQLEQNVKTLTSTVDKANTHMKYYRTQLIKEKVSKANLKPEQKEEHVKRWQNMDIHGDELEFALSTAYSAQEQTAKIGERKNSAYVDDGTREFTNSEPEDKPKKLTVDLLQRKQQTL